jgi:acyl-coenzyme A synthetase/AMP-(fatty) acid ligase
LSGDVVLEYVSGKIPVFKRPRLVRLIAALPRTLNGKIHRLQLMGLDSLPGPMVSGQAPPR